MATEPLKFALIIRIFVERSCRSWNDAAQKCGLSVDRMMKIASGQNEPRASDILRIQEGLGLKFRPKDFEERGISL